MSFMPIFAESRPRLFILAGIPGCGKSTWARNFFPAASIVSSDAIREEKWPGEPYDAMHNETVFGEFHQRLGDLLTSGYDAVADATSLADEARWKLQTIALYHNVDCHLIFFNNPDTAEARNEKRTGDARVPPEAMDVMRAKFIKAQGAILEEKYTSITIIEDVQ